jgi:hypothetical protein
MVILKPDDTLYRNKTVRNSIIRLLLSYQADEIIQVKMDGTHRMLGNIRIVYKSLVGKSEGK